MIRKADLAFMRQALALAEKGRGHTRPNPMVGAVLVRGGRVLARGFHRRAGLPHAEIETLAKKGVRTHGATLYVTLEPCCHLGRTGPCTQAIEAAGIRRVVVGCCDENPLVSGRGILQLRGAGIRVDVGCLGEECRRLNRTFFKWIRARRPWVTLKVASTLDGFISSLEANPRDPSTRDVTGKLARAHGHILRAQHDAVLVGVGTVLTDNPRLTVRLEDRNSASMPVSVSVSGSGSDQRKAAGVVDLRERERVVVPQPLSATRVPPTNSLTPSPARPATREPAPLRVVLDGHLRTPPSARIIRQLGTPPVLIIGAQPRQGARDAASRGKREQALRRAGAEVLLLPADRQGRVPLLSVLRVLAERGIQSLLVEGGSQVHGEFVSARLVDSVAFFFAPRLVGKGRPIVEGRGLDWRNPLRLGPFEVRAIGEDLLLQADVLLPKARRRS
jgi:diaminohydroxyphosphoribosylaminopyrimidine deaminase/5-amino-6-(5-phosphoribosylamino)uracil reductase